MAALLAAALASSCGIIAGVPSIGEGGAAGGTTRVNGACEVDKDCDDGNPCTADECSKDKLCARPPLPDGPAPAAAQTAGDCATIVCAGGEASIEPDDTDTDDGDGCTADACVAGVPSHDPMAAGSFCDDGEGHTGVCDAAGRCQIACEVASDCPATDPCVVASCDSAVGLCVLTQIADGMPPPGVADPPGDCHVHVCMGGVDSQMVDDTDVPATATDCDTELCSNGVPSNAPLVKGNPCSTYMGSQPGFCDGAGTCRECAADSDCPGIADDCQHPFCDATGTCAVVFTPAMTPTTANPAQVQGDCATIVCDGAGGTLQVLDAADAQNDGNACTSDTCTAIGVTTHPLLPDGTTCGTGGTLACVAGACAGCTMSTQCQQPSCMGNVLVQGHTCNGLGQCVAPSPSTQDCAPYLCSTTLKACTTSCATDTQCFTGSYCSGGACLPKQAPGATCSANSQCQSNFCVDGVCCNTACTGTCQACSAAKKGSGPSGTCGAIVAGTDPDNECPDDGAASCSRDGACNGAGACRLYASGTVCASGTCAGGTLTKPKTCNGSGTCVTPTPSTQSCAPYLCTGGACTTICAADTDCASSAYCNGTACVTKLTQGSACTAANQCLTGFCVDGVCCGTACSTACQACSAALKQSGVGNGTCGSAKVSNPDPRNLCGTNPPCGNTGLCASGGVCQLTPGGTQCQASSCSMATFTAPKSCDGSGSCNQGGSTSACPGLLVCGGNTCLTSCGTQDANCVSGAYCDGVGLGACHPKIATGAGVCVADHECVSGHCGLTNDVCCAASCVDQGPATCGTSGACDAAGSCQLYNAATPCAATSCTGSTLITYTLCNGMGTCSGGGSTAPCPGNFVCSSATTCFTSCGTADPIGDARCSSNYYCDGAGGGACQPKHASGMSCTRSGECLSGSCNGGQCN